MIVKVCGMREADNIRAVERTEPDWMGFIFYARSPRHVAVRPAYLPVHCRRVGVFVNAPADELDFRVRDFGLSVVQLHGDESPDACRRLREQGLTVVKALPVATIQDLRAAESYADSAVDYLLFDTSSPRRGGTGKSFDWTLLSAYDGQVPFILSGGICAESITALRAFCHPRWAGIDLNSGFETAPAVKDAAAVATFIAEFRNINPLPHNPA